MGFRIPASDLVPPPLQQDCLLRLELLVRQHAGVGQLAELLELFERIGRLCHCCRSFGDVVGDLEMLRTRHVDLADNLSDVTGA
jgi:hypothetical protein